MVSRQAWRSAKSGSMARGAIGVVVDPVWKVRPVCHRGHGVADLAGVINPASVVRWKLGCPARPGLVAKPAVSTALQGMRHLGSQARHRGYGVADLAGVINPASVVRWKLGCPARPGLVAKPAVSTALQGVWHLRNECHDWGHGVADLAGLINPASMVRRERGCPARSGLVAKPAVGAALQGMRHLRGDRLRHWSPGQGGWDVAHLAVRVGALSVIRRELRCSCNSRSMARPTVSSTLQGMGHLRGDRLLQWSPGHGGWDVAHLAVRVGALSVISGELRCSCNSRSMARPTVSSTLQGMGHLRRECRHGRYGVTGLTDINRQAIVIVRNARSILDTQLVALQALPTANKVVCDGWRGGIHWSRVRKDSMARRAPFRLQQVGAVRWHRRCSRGAPRVT